MYHVRMEHGFALIVDTTISNFNLRNSWTAIPVLGHKVQRSMEWWTCQTQH